MYFQEIFSWMITRNVICYDNVVLDVNGGKQFCKGSLKGDQLLSVLFQ